MSLTPRQRCAEVLRRFRLLQPADYLFFLYLLLRKRKANGVFLGKHPHVKAPPLSILYDIQGNCDVEGFFSSGKDHAHAISSIISSSHDGRPLKILEWGCGPARVLQFLQSPSGEQWNLYGSDYNAHSIDWCRVYLPHIVFLNNDLFPPIKADSASFDVIYCFSVFTHLSETLHYQWINEIVRLLKVGGLFIGTFHGDRYRETLSLEEQKKFDNGGLVIRDKIREGKKNFGAYHGNQFLNDFFAPFSSVWSINEPGINQDVWCAIK